MKRRTKTPYEWSQQYKEKHSLMIERGYEEVSPFDFYRELFPEGSLQEREGENDGKGNIIATQVRPSGKGKTRQWVVTDDLKMLDKVIGDPFGLIPPISFFGKTHTKTNAHELYALAIDIDYVGKQQLKNLLKQFGNGVQLKPTFLVSSGKGVHVYYFFKEPIPLYHNLEEMFHELKEAFIHRLWNDTSSIKPDEPDITGIYQGFRCVGSQSKLGKEYPVRAYRISENRYTLDDMQAFFAKYHVKVDVSPLTVKPRKKTMPIERAKELYPDWYQERIVEGKPNQRRKWVCKPDLYEWWKRKITEEVGVGGRYFSIMALCAYGLKCGISEWKIRRDAYSFFDYLETLTEDEDNHFKRSDVKDALKALKASKKELTLLSTRKWIEEQTKVDIPKNKRNGRSQEQHLQLARGIRQLKGSMGEIVSGGGRPDKANVVLEWKKNNPHGKKIDCHRETGLSRVTIDKWWNKEVNHEK